MSLIIYLFNVIAKKSQDLFSVMLRSQWQAKFSFGLLCSPILCLFIFQELSIEQTPKKDSILMFYYIYTKLLLKALHFAVFFLLVGFHDIYKY